MQDKLQYALDLCNNNKFDEALPILEEITQSDPQNSEAWRTLAQIHWFQKHDPDRAYDDRGIKMRTQQHLGASVDGQSAYQGEKRRRTCQAIL